MTRISRFEPTMASLNNFYKRLVLLVILLILLMFILQLESSQQKSTNVEIKTEPKPLKQQIHLISQWYWPKKNSSRLLEIIKAMELNLRNPHIDSIHLLQPAFSSPTKESVKNIKSNDDNQRVSLMMTIGICMDT